MVQRHKVEKRFRDNGWHFLRHGHKHDIWTNGKVKTQIPRHPKISDGLYKKLISEFKLK